MTTKKKIQSFLGLDNYYRRFVPSFSTISTPLTELIKGDRKKQKIEWTNEAEEAVAILKQLLSEAPVLAKWDRHNPTRVTTDASDTGLGAVLE